jgi:RNA polymerase sigma-70 factor (ECF subfamily)
MAMSLIEEAKNKNPDAFEQLIQPQLQRMYRVAVSMLQNEDDAADAIQETVLKCWQKIGQLKSDEYFETWLIRILINQCKDILKDRKKIVPLEEFPELTHEDYYFTNEWKKILSNLNERYQIVMELYYVDGFSTKEIARMLHITEVNVRSRMVRGRKQLKQIVSAIMD